jgi:hypothetical protein
LAVIVSCVGVVESVNLTVKLEVPVAVGAPVIAPLAGFSDSPTGRAPLVSDHAYGVVPPLADSVWA